MNSIKFDPENGGNPMEQVGESHEKLKTFIRERLLHWLWVYNQSHRDARISWDEGKDRLNCYVNTAYDDIDFGVNLERVINESDDYDLNEDLCHEVAHVCTWPLSKICMKLMKRLENAGLSGEELETLQDDVEDAEEYATTQVHRAVMRAYETNDAD
jgi:hypothetical protein